jgi:hypothetical protein
MRFRNSLAVFALLGLALALTFSSTASAQGSAIGPTGGGSAIRSQPLDGPMSAPAVTTVAGGWASMLRSGGWYSPLSLRYLGWAGAASETPGGMGFVLSRKRALR